MDHLRPSPLISYISSDGHLPQIRELLARGEDPNRQGYGGFTPFLEAVKCPKDNIGVVQELINAGADVNAKTHLGFTALHFAVVNRKRKVVQALIQSGILVNAKSFLGFAPLHLAVTKLMFHIPPIRYSVKPDTWIIDEFLKHDDTDYNTLGPKGQTPLLMAVADLQVCVVSKLLSKNANPNLCNKFGDTPLHVAFALLPGSIEIQLLNSGASIYSANKTGQTPMDILLRKKNRSIGHTISLLKLIVLKYNITKDLKRKLECIPELSEFFNQCCDEVDQMRSDFISGNTTVHDFVLNVFNENQFQNIPLQIHKPIIDRLSRDVYPEYLNDILEKIPESSLLSILEMTACSKTCANSSNVIDLAYLLSKLDIAILISEHLYNVDIFYLIVALSDVSISK